MPMTTAPPKLYTIRDIPRPADMEEYLARVRAIRSALPVLPGTPPVPPDMDRLTYGEANNIELILLQADRAIDSLRKSWIYSGEFESGGI